MTTMRERCLACADQHTDPSWLITYRKSLTGIAWAKSKRMIAPQPVTRKALYIYLHEAAHLVLNHTGRKPAHVQEMEAEKQAHVWMREAGIPVPRSMTKRAKAYVGRKIQQAVKHGVKNVDPAAARYAALPKRSPAYTREIWNVELTAKQMEQLETFGYWVIQRFERCPTGGRFWKLYVAKSIDDYGAEVEAATFPKLIKKAKAVLQ
jgi:hypothetical protein